VPGRDRGGVGGGEVVVHPPQQFHAGVGVVLPNLFRPVQVLHLEGAVHVDVLTLHLEHPVADDERGVVRAEEAGAERVRVEEPLRGDADEVGQLALRVADLLRHQPAQAGELDAAERQVARPHLVGGAGVVALLGGHAAEDRQLVAELRHLRQVFADLQAGGGRLDLLVRPAVVVPRLQVPHVNGGRPAVHPQQDARPLPLRVVVGGAGEGAEPAGHATPEADGPDAEEVPPISVVGSR
jgi:hypothetical protein